MEHFFEAQHHLVRAAARYAFEEGPHFGLPARVDFQLRHTRAGLVKVIRFQVTHQQPVVTQVERIVPPAGIVERLPHFRPNFPVAGLVFFQPVFFNL